MKQILINFLTAMFGFKNYCVTWENDKGISRMKYFRAKRLCYLSQNFVRKEIAKTNPVEAENVRIINVMRVEEFEKEGKEMMRVSDGLFARQEQEAMFRALQDMKTYYDDERINFVASNALAGTYESGDIFRWSSKRGGDESE